MTQSSDQLLSHPFKPSQSLDQLSATIDAIIKQPQKIKALSDSDLIDISLWASIKYRGGNAIIEDDFYDHFLIKELTKRDPNHPLINQVEDDYQSFGNEKIALPEPMLSTQKAYEMKQIELYLDRISKKATELGIDFQSLQFKVMAKLDGFAAYYDGTRLITRGNGTRGTDISRALARGLTVEQKKSHHRNHRNQPTYPNYQVRGAGEIVVKKSYFYQHLVNDFIHPRNFVASVIKEKALDKKTQKAVDDKAVLFIAFSQLDAIYLKAKDLIAKLDQTNQQLTENLDFEFDGLVIEIAAMDQNHHTIRTELGSTLHHHRWQIAYKKNSESAKSTVLDLIAQTGRTGKITPVALISAVKLSGATISRVSAHNYALVEKLEIGKGAKVEIIRSGEVIPKITAIIKPAEKVLLPKVCPSCHQPLIWQTKFLVCPNHHHCKDQIQGSLSYFFVSLDNLDGFGPATIENFYQFGIRKVSEIYQLKEEDLKKIGYQQKTRTNLLTELEKSKNSPLEDWRFLSAFGIERLGTAASIKLLENFSFDEIFNLSLEQINPIDGFAEKTAKAIIKGLKEKEAEIKILQNQFNLIFTETNNQPEDKNLPLAGMSICFTGKMEQNRDQMQTNARKLGAKVVSSLSKNTNWLVVGENAGGSKLTKAKALGIKIISESEYQEIVDSKI